MQDAGGIEDPEFSEDNEVLGWPEWFVNPLDTVSLLEIGFLYAGYSRFQPQGFPRSFEAEE